MKFGTLRKALQTIESLEKHNHAILDDHINGFSPQYCKTLMQNLLSGQSPESYLSKIDKNSKKKVISPVNAVRYEILSRRIKGTIIDTNQMMPLIKDSIVDKSASECKYLPAESIDLIKKSGGGSAQDPFRVWTDNRKLATPFIINTDETKRSAEELKNVANQIITDLNLEPDNTKINVATPIGAQNNSLDEFGWLAVSIDGRMQDTIHVGLRIYSDHILAKLHVGENLQKKFKDNNIKFQFELVDNGGFLLSEFDQLRDAIDYLGQHKSKWFELNEMVKGMELKGIESIGLEQVDLVTKTEILTYGPNTTTDSERLHNRTGGTRRLDLKNSNVETKYLYLIKIHRVSYEGKTGNLYKIGITDRPDTRYKQIASGFGIQDAIGIEPLFCYSNSGVHEKVIKEQLVGNPNIHYSGEFFLSEMNESDIKKMILSYF